MATLRNTAGSLLRIHGHRQIKKWPAPEFSDSHPAKVGVTGSEILMTQRRRRFSPEFKAEAVRLVVEQSRPTAQVAREINVLEGTLGRWVNDYRDQHTGEEPPLSITERAQLRELKKENAELRMRTEFLGKAAAFFAQEYR
jgi:transposase